MELLEIGPGIAASESDERVEVASCCCDSVCLAMRNAAALLALAAAAVDVRAGPPRRRRPAPCSKKPCAPGRNYDKAEFRLWLPNDVDAVQAIAVLVPGSNGDGRGQVDDPVWQAFAVRHKLALVGVRLTDKPHDQGFIEEYVNVSQGSGQALLDAMTAFARAREASGAGDRAVPALGHVGRRRVQLRVRLLEAGARRRVRREQGQHLLHRAGAEGGAERAGDPVHRRQGSGVPHQHDHGAVRDQPARRRACGRSPKSRAPRTSSDARATWRWCCSKTRWRFASADGPALKPIEREVRVPRRHQGEDVSGARRGQGAELSDRMAADRARGRAVAVARDGETMKRYLALPLSSAGLAMFGAALAGQTSAPKTHRLEATPATVAVGYYWSEAKPALRIASGDIIDVDTLLTNNPTGLARAGVPDDKIQASLKAIVDRGDRRSPRARRPHPHRPGVCRRRGAGRRARGEDPLDRSADRLRLQRLQRLRAGELRARHAVEDPHARPQEHDRRSSRRAS